MKFGEASSRGGLTLAQEGGSNCRFYLFIFNQRTWEV